jgi:hypothetical protein
MSYTVKCEVQVSENPLDSKAKKYLVRLHFEVPSIDDLPQLISNQLVTASLAGSFKGRSGETNFFCDSSEPAEQDTYRTDWTRSDLN